MLFFPRRISFESENYFEDGLYVDSAREKLRGRRLNFSDSTDYCRSDDGHSNGEFSSSYSDFGGQLFVIAKNKCTLEVGTFWLNELCIEIPGNTYTRIGFINPTQIYLNHKR